MLIIFLHRFWLEKHDEGQKYQQWVMFRMMRIKKQIRQASEEIIQENNSLKEKKSEGTNCSKSQNLNFVPQSATVSLGSLLNLSDFLVVIPHLRWIYKFYGIFWGSMNKDFVTLTAWSWTSCLTSLWFSFICKMEMIIVYFLLVNCEHEINKST